MTRDLELMRWTDDGGREPADPPACCPAAAELAALRDRAAAVLAGPWVGPETTAQREAVRAVIGDHNPGA